METTTFRGCCFCLSTSGCSPPLDISTFLFRWCLLSKVPLHNSFGHHTIVSSFCLLRLSLLTSRYSISVPVVLHSLCATYTCPICFQDRTIFRRKRHNSNRRPLDCQSVSPFMCLYVSQFDSYDVTHWQSNVMVFRGQAPFIAITASVRCRLTAVVLSFCAITCRVIATFSATTRPDDDRWYVPMVHICTGPPELRGWPSVDSVIWSLIYRVLRQST